MATTEKQVNFNKDDYFLLYSNCIATKGFKRSIISDLQNGFYIFIPNKIYDIINILKTKTLGNFLIENKKLISKIELMDFIDYILEYKLAFFSPEPNLFPEIDNNIEYPSHINDVIIELSKFNYDNINIIINKLDKLNFKHLELRAYNYYELNKLKKIISYCNNSGLRSVEIVIGFNAKIPIDKYFKFINENPIIEKMIVHGAKDVSFQENTSLIKFLNNKIFDSSCCGVINKEHFEVNLNFFFESLKYNNCLYKKLSIDKFGNIKNCPSMKGTFGNVVKDDLLKIVLNENFTKLWKINKDVINVCKDCEFRYICSDCRAYIANTNDKPKKCDYNPYEIKI